MTSTTHERSSRDLVLGPVMVLWLAALVSVAPIPEVAFILQMGGVGSVIGLLVALWRDRRGGSEGDRWLPVALLTVTGLAAGALVVLADLLLVSS